MSLSRAAILGHVDSRIGRVDVPEMGGEVCVAKLTVAEADKIGTVADDSAPFLARIVILGACDENGKRLFTDKDVAAISKLPADALGKVAKAILAHNNLGGDESVEKNVSSETASDDSASASPAS